MINFLGCSAQGVAIASGALTLALLEHLVEHQGISRSEARRIVQSSIDCLEPRISASLTLGRFFEPLRGPFNCLGERIARVIERLAHGSP